MKCLNIKRNFKDRTVHSLKITHVGIVESEMVEDAIVELFG